MEGSGYYIATLDERRRRVRSKGLFARGNGRWTIDGEGLSFRRLMTKEPICIPRHRIRSVRLSRSSWWAGRWLPRRPIVEVEWTCEDGSAMVAGFVLSRDPAETQRAIDLLT